MGLTSTLVLLAAASGVIAAPANNEVLRRGNLPTPVSAATARTYLNNIVVAAESNSPAYDRDLFPHWITISGQCNTRETVLQRDGSNVVTSSTCAATSGTWYSDYDGATWTAASDVDIDHVVPLKVGDATSGSSNMANQSVLRRRHGSQERETGTLLEDKRSLMSMSSLLRSFTHHPRSANLVTVLLVPSCWLSPTR